MRTSASQRIRALVLGMLACLADAAPAQDSSRIDARHGPSEEELLEFIDDEETSIRAAETLSWLHENPIDLNNAPRDELLSIPTISAEDAEAILRLRESAGPFKSVDEVRGLPGGEDIVERIHPYVFIQQQPPERPSHKPPVVLISSRLSGFLPGTVSLPASGVLGNPAKSISRVALRLSGHIQAGLLFEKDTGERTRDGFASGYVSYHGDGIVEQVVLGDYCAEAGHGLVLWRGVSFGRNGNIADGTRSRATRLVPYHLADESHYLRGGALALKTRFWTLPVRWLLILSRTSLAANLNDQGVATSFYTSGLYRTGDELEKRNSVRESLAGTRLECEFPGRGRVGLTYYNSLFDRPVRPTSPNEFSGVRSEVAGGDFGLSLGRMHVFGECARTAGGGTAWTAGLVIPLDSMFRATISYRDYSQDFDNPHAGGYGLQTNTTNERGISLGWSVRLVEGLILQGCVDQCKIPTRTYASILPRTATDFLIQATAFPVPWVRIAAAFRTRRAEAMRSDPGLFSGSVKVQGSTERTSARFALRVEASPHLALKIRIEHGESNASGLPQVDVGNLVSHAVCYTARGMAWECGAAFFQTDSYDARLYDFEGNLRGSIASPALCGRGSRWHILVSWDAIPCTRLAAKYAVTLVERSPIAREMGVQAELRF